MQDKSFGWLGAVNQYCALARRKLRSPGHRKRPPALTSQARRVAEGATPHRAPSAPGHRLDVAADAIMYA